MRTTKIKHIKRIGIRKCLDIEVAHDDHNFVCDGLVTSNSHSCAYAQLAAKTTYLKIKYPKEFFTSLLEMSEYEPEPLAEVTAISKELKDFGIELLPPDLERSGMNFTIEGNNIRYGLNTIKGVSEKTLEPLRDFINYRAHETNKYDVFISARNAKLNIGVLCSLIQAGALSGYQTQRSKLVLEAQSWNLLTDKEKKQMTLLGPKYNYDLLQCIADCRDNKILGSDGKVIMSEKRFGTFKKKFETFREIYLENKKHEKLCNWWFEYTLLGYVYSSPLQEAFDNAYGKISTGEDIRLAKEKTTVKFAGKVIEKHLKKSKNGNRYLQVIVNDGLSEIQGLLFDSDGKLSDLLKNKDKVPEKNNIVVMIGSKADGNTLFLDMIAIIPTKVYMKIRDLKDVNG